LFECGSRRYGPSFCLRNRNVWYCVRDHGHGHFRGRYDSQTRSRRTRRRLGGRGGLTLTNHTSVCGVPCAHLACGEAQSDAPQGTPGPEADRSSHRTASYVGVEGETRICLRSQDCFKQAIIARAWRCFRNVPARTRGRPTVSWGAAGQATQSSYLSLRRTRTA
jgi:hypothetical protein